MVSNYIRIVSRETVLEGQQEKCYAKYGLPKLFHVKQSSNQIYTLVY